jgi:hypothetical protein
MNRHNIEVTVIKPKAIRRRVMKSIPAALRPHVLAVGYNTYDGVQIVWDKRPCKRDAALIQQKSGNEPWMSITHLLSRRDDFRRFQAAWEQLCLIPFAE